MLLVAVSICYDLRMSINYGFGKNYEELEDSELMVMVREGDDHAFELLVLRHQNSVMNFFARNGVYRDVEDLAQETFLKIHRARRRYVPSAKFTTFLYTVARRVMIDWYRSTSRKGEFLKGFAEEAPQEQKAPPKRGEISDAEAALNCLSLPLRETVVLVILKGMAYAEAAEILGVPVGTVKSRISAAMAKMKEELTKDEQT